MGDLLVRDNLARLDRVEFTVSGTPVSHQSHNRQLLRDWVGDVASAASLAVQSPGWTPTTDLVRLQVVCYYEDGPVQIPDEDNLLKPIQDALQGIVYVNDSQVSDGECHKRNLDGRYEVRGISMVLAEAFHAGTEFVHIIVSGPRDAGVLIS